MKNLTGRFNSGGKTRLIENFISLSFLRGINYILPLITLPYLTRILGVEKFGLVMFAQAFVWYFMNISDYGFYLSATREIAVNRDDRNAVDIIFSSVIFIKLALATAGFLSLGVIVFAFAKFRPDWILYLTTYGMVFGYTIFPEWFFQGMERMKYITIINLTAKSLFTISIFIFVRRAADYNLVPILNSLGFLVAGLIGLTVAFRQFKVRLFWPGMENIKGRLKDGFHIFITGLMPQLYNNSATFILGLLTNNILVGYYAAASKVMEALNSIIYIISQTFFPYLNRQLSDHRSFRNIIIGTGLIISVFVFWQARFLVGVIFGAGYESSIILLRILSFSPILIAIIVCYGTNYLLIIKEDRLYLKITMTASLAGFASAWFLIPWLGHIGAAINIVLARGLLAGLTFRATRRFSSTRMEVANNAEAAKVH
nr:flippase [candidate division Zixibacteria bacterium]